VSGGKKNIGWKKNLRKGASGKRGGSKQRLHGAGQGRVETSVIIRAVDGGQEKKKRDGKREEKSWKEGGRTLMNNISNTRCKRTASCLPPPGAAQRGTEKAPMSSREKARRLERALGPLLSKQEWERRSRGGQIPQTAAEKKSEKKRGKEGGVGEEKGE